MTKAAPPERPWAFIYRVGDALLRILALFILGVAHRMLSWGLSQEIPGNIEGLMPFVEDVSFIFFLIVYFYLLWDMIKIFIPSLNPKPLPSKRKRP